MNDLAIRSFRYAAFLYVLFWAVAPASGQEAARRLQEANQAYQDGRFEDAIEKYEAILQEGYGSGVLHYNLGNAYYRAGQAGRAVLNYERALKWSPGDRQALQNLEAVRSGLKDALLVVPESALVYRWRVVQGLMPSDAWAGLGLVFLWAGIGGLALWLGHRVRRYKKAGFIAGWIFLGLSIFPFLFAIGRARQEFRKDYAIVMVEEAQLRVAPERESQEVLLLHEGAKVRILDAIGSWYQVRLSDTSEGWLPADVLERI